jgi:uncharacterized protein (DUF488 family)
MLMVGIVMDNSPIIWTIGHSTRSAEEFLTLLNSQEIALLADIRSYPGSRTFPHFGKDVLEKYLNDNGIEYIHIKGLGGRRKSNHDSQNIAWRMPAFRGYADYMETDGFIQAIQELERLALEKRTAYMCSEAVWWRCHRGLVSDWLKAYGWQVMHIFTEKKTEEHPFTGPAKIIEGKLSYSL